MFDSDENSRTAPQAYVKLKHILIKYLRDSDMTSSLHFIEQYFS